MNPGLHALDELALRLLVALTLGWLAMCLAFGLAALAVALLRRGVSRWLAGPGHATSFYVGRLEDARAAIYAVDGDRVRLLFEATARPGRWAPVAERTARVLAADAIGVEQPLRRGVRRIARLLSGASQEGFVLERRMVEALAERSPRRRWGERLRAAATRSRLSPRPAAAARPLSPAARARPAGNPALRRTGPRAPRQI